MSATRLTADDWRTLQFAPLWVFSSLVGHYRRFDPLEVDAFSRSLEAPMTRRT